MRSMGGNTLKVPGKTWIVIDVSGSMDQNLSEKGETRRLEAAMALAIMAREICETVRIFTFSDQVVEVPAFRGMGLANAIHHSQQHGGTYLGQALSTIANQAPGQDRMIVITDEQSYDSVLLTGSAKSKNYLLNVASYKPSLQLSQSWTRINGLSEQFMEFVIADEGLED